MITKQEAMAKLTEREEAEYTMCAAQIDQALLTFDGRTVVSINPSQRVRGRLVQAYEKSGWKVECGDDQRDGAWMSFE